MRVLRENQSEKEIRKQTGGGLKETEENKRQFSHLSREMGTQKEESRENRRHRREREREKEKEKEGKVEICRENRGGKKTQDEITYKEKFPCKSFHVILMCT